MAKQLERSATITSSDTWQRIVWIEDAKNTINTKKVEAFCVNLTHTAGEGTIRYEFYVKGVRFPQDNKILDPGDEIGHYVAPFVGPILFIRYKSKVAGIHGTADIDFYSR